tara:strand:- start:263 stop:634 length:372 start_codon:yes stop_codon:yes gene_type:complete
MNEFYRYLCVGSINFLICVLSMWLLSSIGVHYVLYTALGYSLAISCSFFLNLKFTFKNSHFTKTRFFKFISISGCNLLLVELIQMILIQYFSARELYAIVIGMIWYTLSGFVVNKFYVYHSAL